MDYASFDKELQKLRNTYGEKLYSEERAKAIYVAVLDFPAEILKYAIDNLIAESRQAPMRSDILRALENVQRYKTAKAESLEPDPCNLKMCDGFGRILKELEGYIYAFRCPCPAGEPYKNNHTLFTY